MDLAGVRVTAADRIGAAGTGWATWSAVMHEAVILAAAQAVGGAQYAMDITVQYAKDRQQFDKPLGAFQALAHYLADAATTVDGAEVLVHEAAWALAEGRSVAKLAPMAKLYACRTFRDVTATAQQIFGGIGFTVEFDIQLYFRRAKQLQMSWWEPRVARGADRRAGPGPLNGGRPGGRTAVPPGRTGVAPGTGPKVPDRRPAPAPMRYAGATAALRSSVRPGRAPVDPGGSTCHQMRPPRRARPV